MATVTVSTKPSRNGQKIYHYLEWGRGKGERVTSGIWTYAKPKTRLEKSFNEDQLQILEHKKAQLTVDMNGNLVGFVNPEKLEKNFFDFYDAFVEKNKRKKKRHLENSGQQLKKFVEETYKTDVLYPSKITEDFCKLFRQFLLDAFNGETPANYFSAFKKVISAASRQGYFRQNPVEDVAAKKKSSKPKDILTAEELVDLWNAPCYNPDVKKAYLFCCYTGLAWCDIKDMEFNQIKKDMLRYQRNKSEVWTTVPLHPVAVSIVNTIEHKSKDELVFKLPSHTGAKKAIDSWIENAGIDKNITWHSARHYVSVALQLKGVDHATVAGILGHSSTQYVQKVYKRYVMTAAIEGINKL
jgi:integrase/recombinase XerD